jgi:hypothetical protein
MATKDLAEIRATYRKLFEQLAKLGSVIPGGIEVVAETCHGGEFCHGGTTKSFDREELLKRKAAG